MLRKQQSEETELHLPEISHKNLQRKTQKAVKIYKIFEKIGIDNIKYITTYSANSISELTNDKVQKIIDNFSKQNPKELHHMSLKDESSIPEISAKGPGQNHVTEKILPVNVLSVPQVISSKKSRLLISILPKDPEEK